MWQTKTSILSAKTYVCRHRIAKVLLIGLLYLFANSLLAASNKSENNNHNDEQQTVARLKAVKNKIGTLQQTINTTKSRHHKAQQSLQKIETQTASILQKIQGIQKQIQKQQQQLNHLNQQRNTLLKAKHQQQSIIQQYIRAAYQTGRQEYLKMLLNQEQPDKLPRLIRYYDYFNQARSEKVNHYLTTINELNRIEPEIHLQTEKLEKNRDQYQQQYSTLQNTKKKRQEIVNSFHDQLKTQDDKLQLLLKDRSHLEKLLNAVEEAIANIPIPSGQQAFNQRKGKLPWPIDGARIKHDFGSPRQQSNLRWQGVLMNIAAGTPVKAIHYGRVVFADWLRGTGWLIILDHGDGYMSIYAHNQQLLKTFGDWVNSGETIARVGNSGGQEMSGLYFEIRYNSRPQNPTKWCLAKR